MRVGFLNIFKIDKIILWVCVVFIICMVVRELLLELKKLLLRFIELFGSFSMVFYKFCNFFLILLVGLWCLLVVVVVDNL